MMLVPRVAAFVGAGVLVLIAGVALGRATSSPEAGPSQHADDPSRMGDATRRVIDEDKRPQGPSAIEHLAGRSAEGAVAAAVRYAVTLDGPVVFDEVERRALLEKVAAREAASALEERLRAAATLITTRLGIDADDLDAPGTVWRPVPAGWELRSFDGHRASVAIWGTGVLVLDGRQIDQPGWRTTTVDVVWERDAWRLLGIRSEGGPTPPSAGREGIAALGERINSFQPFEVTVSERADRR